MTHANGEMGRHTGLLGKPGGGGGKGGLPWHEAHAAMFHKRLCRTARHRGQGHRQVETQRAISGTLSGRRGGGGEMALA